MNNQINAGLLADYWRAYRDDPVPLPLREETNFTDIDVLRTERLPADRAQLRSLALAYALDKKKSTKLKRVLYDNRYDACFQLYALLSEGMTEVEPIVLFSERQCLEDIAIIIHLLKNKVIGEEYSDSEVAWALQHNARNIVAKDKDLLVSDAFNEICKCYQEEELCKYWNRSKQRVPEEMSSIAKFFNSFGVEYKLLLKYLSKVLTYYRYDSYLLDYLCQKCSVWTDEEKKLVTSCWSSFSNSQIPISRYQNYEWAYANLVHRFDVNRFYVPLTDQLLVKKLSLLRPQHRLLVLCKICVEENEIPSILKSKFDKDLRYVFASYRHQLQPLWEKCREDCSYEYDSQYLVTFLKKQNDLSRFLQYLNDQTFAIFVGQVDNKKVKNALLAWCKNNNCYYRLRSCHLLFSASIQTKICKQDSLIATGRSPFVDEDADVSGIHVLLQPFALARGYRFEELTDREQVLLASVVTESDKHSEKALVNATKIASKYSNHQDKILKYSLMWGTDYADNIFHYFSCLCGNEFQIKKGNICSDWIRHAEFWQTTEEAKYFKGHKFERTRDLSEEFSDKTLDFFEWCLTDKHSVVIPDDATIADFGRIYVRDCLKLDTTNIGNWDDSQLSQYDLVEKITQDILDWPPELVSRIPNDFYLDIVLNNLQLHSMDWYRKYDNWVDIITYKFDWTETMCLFAEQIVTSQFHSRAELFISACGKYEYTEVLQDPSKAFM